MSSGLNSGNPLFEFLYQFNGNCIDLWRALDQTTLKKAHKEIVLMNKLIEKTNDLSNKMAAVLDDKKISEADQIKALEALDKEYYETGYKIFNVRAAIVAIENSQEELAKRIPLSVSYPELKADLTKAGLKEILALVDIAEKGNLPPPVKKTKQQKPPTLN